MTATLILTLALLLPTAPPCWALNGECLSDGWHQTHGVTVTDDDTIRLPHTPIPFDGYPQVRSRWAKPI